MYLPQDLKADTKIYHYQSAHFIEIFHYHKSAQENYRPGLH